jgi:hypothetical protein
MPLVAAPNVPFEELDRVLDELGWFLESESQAPPLIPGEPELCVYTHRQADARITYTFNPAVTLRVLAFDGQDAIRAQVEVARGVALLDAAGIAALLESSDKAELLLGLWAAKVTLEWRLLGAIERLAQHGDSEVARVAAEVRSSLRPDEVRQVASVLHTAKSAAADRSLSFAHLGDAEMRRQVLRWLAHDFSETTPHIAGVLRAGLTDPDEEVRVTARWVGERLAAQGRAPAALPVDDRSLLAHALTTPLFRGPPPETLPSGVQRDGATGYRLQRCGAALCWVGAIDHWLGEGESVRRLRSPGFFIAREPVSSALASWALAAARGPLGTASRKAARTHLCARAEALAIAAALTRIEGVSVQLPTPELWEMAARGSDGRRFPWGNREEDAGAKSQPSPWGCERMVGGAPEWTSTDVVCGGPRPLPCARQRPASDVTHAALRPVIPGG